ncbi:MAG: nucleotidyltransferase family protein [Elusimicrobiota bacterium]
MENAAFALLLAAGRGKRAGGPKAWLDCGGTTLLERQVRFLRGRFPPLAVAVSVQPLWLDRCRALDGGVHWVPVDPDLPPLAALQSLLEVLHDGRWAFLHHVDMPVWEGELFDALWARRADAERGGSEAVVPVHGGRGGHPVLLAPAALAALRALDPLAERLDRWLHGRPTLRVDVPQACVLENWNLPGNMRPFPG